MKEKRDKIEAMIERIKDEEDKARFEAALEGYWNDEVSLDEMIDDLRDYLADQRRGF